MGHRPLARPPAGSWAHTAHVCGPRGGGPRAGLRQQFCTVRLAYQAFPLAAAHATESAAFTCVVHGGVRQTSGGCAGQTPTGPGARRRLLQTGPSSVLCFASRLSGTCCSPTCVAGPGARGRDPAWGLTGQVGSDRRRQAEAMPGCTGRCYVSIPAASGALAANEGTLRCPPTRAQVLEGGVNPRRRRLRRRRAGRPGCAAFCAGLVPRNSLSDTLIEGYQLCFASRFWLPNF